MTMVTQQRLAQRFALYDLDGDGDVDRSDWEAEAKRIVQAFNESKNSPRGRALIDAYTYMWEYLAKLGGIDSNGAYTVDKFVDVMQKHVVDQGDAGFSNALRPTIQAIVALCDVDGDGQINPEEFNSWLDAIGVDKADAEQAFADIDKNNSGYVSVHELVNAVWDYHQGKIDAPLLGR